MACRFVDLVEIAKVRKTLVSALELHWLGSSCWCGAIHSDFFSIKIIQTFAAAKEHFKICFLKTI